MVTRHLLSLPSFIGLIALFGLVGKNSIWAYTSRPDVNSNGSGANISLGTDFYAYPIARSYTFGITGNW